MLNCRLPDGVKFKVVVSFELQVVFEIRVGEFVGTSHIYIYVYTYIYIYIHSIHISLSLSLSPYTYTYIHIYIYVERDIATQQCHASHDTVLSTV